MRPSFPSLGRGLSSAALRYCHPLVAGRCGASWPAANRRHLLFRGADSTPEQGVETAGDERLARLEALFFLSQQAQTSRKLAQLAGLADGTKARTLVRALNRIYDAGGSAFRVEEVAGGYQLMTRTKFAPWLRRLHSAPEVRLSAPAMETLAVVAYRQPVLRAEIEAIRGVQSGEVLRQLIERDFVRIAGRSNELGRPFLYGTTKQFLQIFGLRRLDELPRADVLRQQAAAPNNIEASCCTDLASETNQSQVPEEETNVTTNITQTRRETPTEPSRAAVMQPRRNAGPGGQEVFGKFQEEDDELDEDEDDDDDDDDEDLDDEPWEEVEDDDEDLDEDEDEDWDEDEEWDEEEDEDWEDDDDDDWEDDDEEEEDDDEK